MSLQSSYISEILIFNDDENSLLKHQDLTLDQDIIKIIKIFNPIDFGFKGRK